MNPYSPANKPAFRLPDGIENELTEELLRKYLEDYYYGKHEQRELHFGAMTEAQMAMFDEAIKKEFARQHEIMYNIVIEKIKKLEDAKTNSSN